MKVEKITANLLKGTRVGLAAIALSQFSVVGPWASNAKAQELSSTMTPIKHVIIIVGENRTFDHIFATYQPKKGETIENLLSKHIVNEDGTPGENYALATQYSADDTHKDKFETSPQEKSL